MQFSKFAIRNKLVILTKTTSRLQWLFDGEMLLSEISLYRVNYVLHKQFIMIPLLDEVRNICNSLHSFRIETKKDKDAHSSISWW